MSDGNQDGLLPTKLGSSWSLEYHKGCFIYFLFFFYLF